MRHALFLLAAAAAVAPAYAADAPKPNIHIIGDEPLSGNDKMHVVTGITEWPVGGSTARHFHAGDEYAIVLEGAIEIDNDGQPPHIYKAGETYHNTRGTIHVTKNANNGPSKLTFVLITDKGQPLQVPAP